MRIRLRQPARGEGRPPRPPASAPKRAFLQRLGAAAGVVGAGQLLLPRSPAYATIVQTPGSDTSDGTFTAAGVVAGNGLTLRGGTPVADRLAARWESSVVILRDPNPASGDYWWMALAPGGNVSFFGGANAPAGRSVVVNGSLTVGLAGGLTLYDKTDSARIEWGGGRDFSLRDTWGSRLTITSVGNVGIGTEIPQSRLDVAGAIAVSGVRAIDATATATKAYYAP